MKKKIVLQCAAISACICVLVLLFQTAVELRSTQILSLRKTWIAAYDIQPRHKIREEDLIQIEIPEAYLAAGTVNEKEEIVGKYTDIQGKIPAGSPFYADMLYEEKDLPDYPEVQLKKGQSAYTLETDLARIGGTIVPGQRVDVYAVLKMEDGTPVTGCLFSHARVIAVKDRQGLDLSDENSTGTPYIAILAIPQEDVSLLSRAEEAGEIRLFASGDTYDSKEEAVLNKDSEVINFIFKDGKNEE